MPKIKAHHSSGVTLSMKNMFDVVRGTRFGRPKTRLEKPLTIRRLLSTWFPSFDIFMGCGCNCGCTLLHIGNVSKHLRVILCARKTSVSCWLNVACHSIDLLTVD